MHDEERIALAARCDVAGDRDAGPHPDHHAYLLERDGTPVALFSGGSLMVGTVGRTDLCGPELAEPLAREMFHSLRRLDDLPDDLAVYPTHGAGSFCSAPGGAERTTTLGRERATNPLFRIDDEDEFVEQLLAGFGTFPTYFPRLPELNRRGPRRYDAAAPARPARRRRPSTRHVAAGALVVDARPIADVRRRAHPRLDVERAATGVRQLARLARRPRPARSCSSLDDDQDRDELVRQCLDIGHEQPRRRARRRHRRLASRRAAGSPTIQLVDPAGDRRHRGRRPPAQRVRRRARPRRRSTSSSAPLAAQPSAGRADRR